MSRCRVLRKFHRPFFRLVKYNAKVCNCTNALTSNRLQRFLLERSTSTRGTRRGRRARRRRRSVVITRHQFSRQALSSTIKFSHGTDLSVIIGNNILLQGPQLIYVLVFILVRVFSLRVLSIIALSNVGRRAF